MTIEVTILSDAEITNMITIVIDNSRSIYYDLKPSIMFIAEWRHNLERQSKGVDHDHVLT